MWAVNVNNTVVGLIMFLTCVEYQFIRDTITLKRSSFQNMFSFSCFLLLTVKVVDETRNNKLHQGVSYADPKKSENGYRGICGQWHNTTRLVENRVEKQVDYNIGLPGVLDKSTVSTDYRY